MAGPTAEPYVRESFQPTDFRNYVATLAAKAVNLATASIEQLKVLSYRRTCRRYSLESV